MRRASFFISLTMLMLDGCTGLPNPERNSAEILSALSLRQKIGQRFIGWIPRSGFDEEVKKLTESGHVGGFIIYKWNFNTIEDIRKLTEDLQSSASIPLFLSADQEGGRVAAFRFPEFVQLPAAFHLAKNLPADAVESAAYINAVQLKSIGINMNFAPVLDLYPIPDKTIIGDRSFGGDELKVAVFGQAFVRGTLRGGVLPVIKHFPGHGISTVDSHGKLPVITSLKDKEFERHLAPFRELINDEAPAVMPAHIMYPGIDPEYPVTLSEQFIKQLLREELGFTGITISDGLSMGALSKHYSLEDTLIRCFTVGIDIILVHSQYSVAELVETVAGLVESGVISESQIDEGALRVLSAKKRAGLFEAMDGCRE